VASLSLRARLLLSVIGLVTVALVVSGAATYTALQTFLTDQLDSNLRSGVHSALDLFRGGPGGGGPGGGTNQVSFPPGTYIALYSPDGRTLVDAGTAISPFDSSLAHAHAVLATPLPNAGNDTPTLETVEGTGGVSRYRVLIESLDEANGEFLVLALPMTEAQATLGHLLLLEGIVGAVVLLTGGALAWWLVRVSLRPLARIEEPAAASAAGDLGRRVEPASANTEVGKLGLALNAMLAQIELAFAERTRSEQKLREFMAAASHELRTPLTSIRGYAEMLRRGAEASPEDAGQARRRIEEESVRMTGLVDDMLLLARLDQGRPLEQQGVDLARLASDACADARAVARTRRISLDAPDHLWFSGDEARLRQAIGNLVRNAIVHTPAHAPVEVTVRALEGSAVLEVADHGRGLPAAERARVFEPFYRSDAGRSRDRGGAGLGLSIVAAVVAAHAGQVEVLDTPGGGATFRVTLPIREEAQAPARVELRHDEPKEELPAAG
jgi:two-component system OmpR family sensor kinase